MFLLQNGMMNEYNMFNSFVYAINMTDFNIITIWLIDLYQL